MNQKYSIFECGYCDAAQLPIPKINFHFHSIIFFVLTLTRIRCWRQNSELVFGFPLLLFSRHFFDFVHQNKTFLSFHFNFILCTNNITIFSGQNRFELFSMRAKKKPEEKNEKKALYQSIMCHGQSMRKIEEEKEEKEKILFHWNWNKCASISSVTITNFFSTW